MHRAKCLQNIECSGTLILVSCVLKRVMLMQTKILQKVFTDGVAETFVKKILRAGIVHT